MSDGPGASARALIRASDRATLSTVLVREGMAGWPYGSLVMVATAQDLSPLLLLSDLADHTKNIARDTRVALLFDATAGVAEPLTAARLSVLGRIQRDDGEATRTRYLARHPSAAAFAGFGDFHFYRVTIEAAHLVAGFGKIHWLDAAAFRPPEAPAALVAAEGDIVDHMNADHGDALDAYASQLAGRQGAGWRMTGIDPEGFDLRREGEIARIAFSNPVVDPGSARAELVRLARQARGGPPG